jgi:hypothetical protein
MTERLSVWKIIKILNIFNESIIYKENLQWNQQINKRVIPQLKIMKLRLRNLIHLLNLIVNKMLIFKNILINVMRKKNRLVN